jgi:hypothetical protein
MGLNESEFDKYPTGSKFKIWAAGDCVSVQNDSFKYLQCKVGSSKSIKGGGGKS